MNFKDAIEARRQAAKSKPVSEKPISEMSEEELDREQDRLEQEIRSLKEEAVRTGREAISAPRKVFLPNKKRRPYWK